MSEKVDIDERVAALAEQIPGVMNALMGLHGEVVKDGALSAKTKETMMVGLSIALHCENCLRKHIQVAVSMGATREEIMEVVGATILMAGGPAVAYGSTVVLDTLDELNV